MNRIIASTALALMLGTSAYAQTAAPMTTYAAAQTGDIYASKLIGMRIYAAEAQYDTLDAATPIAAGAEAEWDDIGEVNDVILGQDGQIKAVVLGVGGFIGIGEKDVAVPMDQIKMVREAADADDFFLVVNTNKESLEAAAEFKRADDVAMEARTDVTQTAEAVTEKVEDGAAATAAAAGAAATAVTNEVKEETAELTATTNENGEKVYTNQAADATVEPVTEGTTTAEQTVTETRDEVVAETVVPADRPMLMRPSVEREGYAEVASTELTADDLEGARVYGVNEEDIGEVGELLLAADGTAVQGVVLDVGGFLGLGERKIAVTLDELTIMRNADGSDLRVFIDATQEALEAQPEYQPAG